MAMWFWLLHVGAVVRLRDYVVFIKNRKRKRGCLTWRGHKTKDSISWTWKLVFVTIDPIWHKKCLLSGTELIEEIKLIFALQHYSLKTVPKYRNTTTESFTKVAVVLNIGIPQTTAIKPVIIFSLMEGLAFNLQKNATFLKYNKVKHNKTRSTSIC